MPFKIGYKNRPTERLGLPFGSVMIIRGPRTFYLGFWTVTIPVKITMSERKKRR